MYPVREPSYTCTCPPAGTPRSVWGSGPFTGDSDICTAALFAGVVGREGGLVVAERRDGQSSYPAGQANGVKTQRWAAYDVSFDFAAPAPAPAVPAAPQVPVVAGDGGGEPVCTSLDYSRVETVCRCEPGQGTGTPVWGSSPYVAGSDLCAAARHAEVIGLDGGVISVIRVPGLTSYRGSERGGIKTADWGEYNESFIVNAN